MIGIDTNVLVRYLVEDDPKQSAEAARLVERTIERNETLFVSQIVLCELVWVLSYAYHFSRGEIVTLLESLRRAAQLDLEFAEEVRRAVDSYAAGRGDFADHLLAERAISRGCRQVATFDRPLLSDPRFVPVRSA